MLALLVEIGTVELPETMGTAATEEEEATPDSVAVELAVEVALETSVDTVLAARVAEAALEEEVEAVDGALAEAELETAP